MYHIFPVVCNEGPGPAHFVHSVPHPISIPTIPAVILTCNLHRLKTLHVCCSLIFSFRIQQRPKTPSASIFITKTTAQQWKKNHFWAVFYWQASLHLQIKYILGLSLLFSIKQTHFCGETRFCGAVGSFGQLLRQHATLNKQNRTTMPVVGETHQTQYHIWKNKQYNKSNSTKQPFTTLLSDRPRKQATTMSTTPTRHSADRLPTTHWAA